MRTRDARCKRCGTWHDQDDLHILIGMCNKCLDEVEELDHRRRLRQENEWIESEKIAAIQEARNIQEQANREKEKAKELKALEAKLRRQNDENRSAEILARIKSDAATNLMLADIIKRDYLEYIKKTHFWISMRELEIAYNSWRSECKEVRGQVDYLALTNGETSLQSVNDVSRFLLGRRALWIHFGVAALIFTIAVKTNSIIPFLAANVFGLSFSLMILFHLWAKFEKKAMYIQQFEVVKNVLKRLKNTNQQSWDRKIGQLSSEIGRDSLAGYIHQSPTKISTIKDVLKVFIDFQNQYSESARMSDEWISCNDLAVTKWVITNAEYSHPDAISDCFSPLKSQANEIQDLIISEDQITIVNSKTENHLYQTSTAKVLLSWLTSRSMWYAGLNLIAISIGIVISVSFESLNGGVFASGMAILVFSALFSLLEE